MPRFLDDFDIVEVEPVREVRPIFERLELGLRERVIVRYPWP